MAEEDQYRRPEGDEGAKVLEKMNEHHKDLSAWAIALVPEVFTPSRVLDIGCGGGNALRVMSMKWPRSLCDGIDVSEKAVEVSTRRNSFLIAAGKVRIAQAGVPDIPFPDGEFDLITAIETYFFWPDLKECINAAASKLREGGIMLIVSEQYFNGKNDAELEKTCQKHHMTLVGNDEMVSIMEGAGMKVSVSLDEDRNWVAFLGRKQ